MTLMLCPECEDTASDRALTCPHCGYPIARQVVEEACARADRSQSRGGLFFSGILVAALGAALVWPSSTAAQSKRTHTAADAALETAPEVRQPRAPLGPPARPLAPVQDPAPQRIHDGTLAKRGHALLEQLMDEYDLDPEAYQPTLFGSATRSPRAAIYVPTAAWNECTPAQRVELSHLAASLVRAHWARPEVFAGYDSRDPNAPFFRANAALMTPDSWVVLGGEPTDIGARHAVLRSTTVLASGDHIRLSPAD